MGGSFVERDDVHDDDDDEVASPGKMVLGYDCNPTP